MTVRDTPRELRLIGAILLAGAAVSAAAAALHMRALAQAYGLICGSGPGALAHCAACYAAVALLVSGLALLFVAGRRGRPA